MKRWLTSRKFQIFGSLWIGCLGIALLLSAQNAYHWSVQVEEYAFGCDSFGYLRMAREIRRAAAKRELPQFHLESRQTRLLIDRMQTDNLPLRSWDEMVAPHAHHYFPAAGHVGVQYPPGTGMALALFPEGDAVHGLNKTVIGLLSGLGILMLVAAGAKQSWASAGFVALVFHLALDMLAEIWNLSFSMNAVLVPLILACLGVVVALGLQARVGHLWPVGLLCFLAGCFLGLAILIRLPVVLLVPGFVVLLWSRTWRPGILTAAFGLGVILTGILPVLVHQHRLAGAWYLPTYGPHDREPPDFALLRTNVLYYFGTGPGSAHNWAPFVSAVGIAGLLAWRGRRNPAPVALGWKRLTVAALVLWALPTAYFLTHRIATPYYMMPAALGTVALLGFGSLTIERLAPAHRFSDSSFQHSRLSWIALFFALLPGIVTVGRTAVFYAPVLDSPEVPPPRLSLPAELADDRAWVWADMLTGTLWYHADKPAFKIGFGDGRTRAIAYRFVSERGEPQYLIRDSEEMQRIMDEIAEMGGTLIRRGEVEGCPYFLIRWPEESRRAR